MQRMNPTDGHNLPYWWSALLGIFSVLSLQDYVFIIGALISAFFTIKTYYAKRKEERERLDEEKNARSCWPVIWLMSPQSTEVTARLQPKW
nr:Uncharacterised protein [Klebsiella pneumoniae]